MTGRRQTPQERERLSRLEDLVGRCGASYVASSPWLFASRIQMTSALSRIEMFKMIEDLPGAVIETGVYRGNSLMLLAQLSQVLEPFAINRKFIGFDSFAGFSSIDERHDPSNIGPEMFSDTDLSILREAIEVFDIDRPVNRLAKIELVVGDIVDKAAQYAEKHSELIVAMLILDSDLYLPTKAALEAFVPLMPKGGLIVFDELAYEPFPGETQALKEFFTVNSLELRRLRFDSSVVYVRLP